MQKSENVLHQHGSPTRADYPSQLNSMMPVTENPHIDGWLSALDSSGNVDPNRLDRVRELAVEANAQWRRKELVQLMADAVMREGRRTVPIRDIFDVYGVHFTIETMQIVEQGIQQSLRNFCRILQDVLSVWDADFADRHDLAMLRSRVDIAAEQARLCLWSSLDSSDLSQQVVHSRLVRAVEGLWNSHAKPAIESEHHHLCEGIQRLHSVSYMCDEYLRPRTGGRAVPSKFSTAYARVKHRVIAALAWLLGNASFISDEAGVIVVREMLAAFQSSETEARATMDSNAAYARELALVVTRRLEALYKRSHTWDGWHGVVVWGDDSEPPAGVVSALVVQPPSYSASYWNTSRVHCSVVRPKESFLYGGLRFQPVVRFCALLRALVCKEFLRLDVMGVDYLRLLAHADHARYHRNVNKIVEDELMPVGHLAGIDFNPAWFHETRAPIFYSQAPTLSDLSLVLCDDDTEKAVASCAPGRGLTGNSDAQPRSSGATLPKPVPEGVVLDHCVLTCLSALARSKRLCNALHVGVADVEPSVRQTLSMSIDVVPVESLNQRLASILKMFGAALCARGFQASFGTAQSHPRLKKLTIECPKEWQLVDNKSPTRVAELAEQIASHLHHGTVPLPEGVTWNIPDRTRRRRRVRDAKNASEVLLRRCGV